MTRTDGNSEDRDQVLLAWCGPIVIIGTVISLILVAGLIPPPPAYLSAEEVVTLYRGGAFVIRFGLFLAIGATAMLVPFSAAISVRLVRKSRARYGLAATQLASGAVGAIILITAFILMMTAAFDLNRPAEITKALHDAGWLMLLLPYAPFCVQYTVIAVAVLTDPLDDLSFPRWVAYYNLWVAVSFIPTGLVAFFMTGPFTWHGVVGFWIPIMSYGGWFIVMFFNLRRPSQPVLRLQ